MSDPFGSVGEDSPGVLRVLTWNVRRLKDDRAAVVAILRDAAADVVCLQEAPKGAFARTRLRSLARAAGLRYVAGGPDSAGTAVLASARADIIDPVAFTLPRGSRFAQRRGAVLVTARRLTGSRPEPAIRIGCTHLGLDPAERREHAALVRDRLTASGLPVVLAGDLNEPPGGPTWAALAAALSDPAPAAGVTFSVARPRHRIDAVLTGRAVETVEYGHWRPAAALLARASDHHPVLSLIRGSVRGGDGPADVYQGS